MPADDAGRRMDSASAYLDPVLGPAGACSGNLEVIQGVTVTRILLEGSRAVGVEYLTSPDSEPQVLVLQTFPRNQESVVFLRRLQDCSTLIQGLGPCCW